MTAAAPTLPGDLEGGLRRLRLGAMRRLAPELLVTAKTQRWAPEEFLRTLIETEIASRDASNARGRLKAAAFPLRKTLDEFNVASSSVVPATFGYLASLEWIAAKENLCLVGPAGTGKSHCEVDPPVQPGHGARLVPVTRRDPKSHWPCSQVTLLWICPSSRRRRPGCRTLAVLASSGVEIDDVTVATDAFGDRRMLAWVRQLTSDPERRCWAIEGTGSFGAGLMTYLLEQGEWVVEIDRPARPARRNGAKSDVLDAYRAAREALARAHLAQPRRRGTREAIRVLLCTREGAVRARSRALCHLQALLVNAPTPLRDQLRRDNVDAQVQRCARLRVMAEHSIEHRATVRALRATARRVQALTAEADDLEAELELLVADHAPALLPEPGVGTISAAQVLNAWSHAGRLPLRGSLRDDVGGRSDPCLVRPGHQASAESWRRSSAEPRAAHHRALADALSPRRHRRQGKLTRRAIPADPRRSRGTTFTMYPYERATPGLDRIASPTCGLVE